MKKVINYDVLTTVIPNTMTNANDPRPMTTTAMAQSGIPPTSSSSTEGDGTWFAVTEKNKIEEITKFET